MNAAARAFVTNATLVFDASVGLRGPRPAEAKEFAARGAKRAT